LNRSAPSDDPSRPRRRHGSQVDADAELTQRIARAPDWAPSTSNGVTMILVRRALVGCIIFARCLVGVLLQRLLPTQHLADAKGAITTIQGVVTLLLALVLGLLIWTSFGGCSGSRRKASIRSSPHYPHASPASDGPVPLAESPRVP
jgi:hypothetical protein